MAHTASQTHAPQEFLLDGRWTEGEKQAAIQSPWTGKAVCQIHEAGAAHARAAADAARRAMPAMRALTAAQRSHALRLISEGISKRAEEIAGLIRDQVGKPMAMSRAEVQRAARTFMLSAEEALRLPGEIVYPDSEPHGAGMVGRIQYFPVGPVLGITPFNFPLNLVAHKVAPALAAGCPIVIKPPPQGPGAALILGEIALESGLPPAALQVLPGGVDAGQALCACEEFAAVSFTGSARAGWAIKKNALPRQKVLLEMGGNAALIVDESADLDAAAKAASLGGYAYAGQICISTQRIFVHRRIAAQFEQKLAHQILTAVRTGADAGDENVWVGPLIDKSAADRIENWTLAAANRGAKVLIKGERRGERLISPWLLEDVPADEPLSCEEVFGPVVVMQRVASFEEAVASANNSKFGLQTSVYTQSLHHAELAYKDLESGAVLVNIPTTFRLDAALYGGVKDSGFGREGAREVIRTFSEPKLLVVKP